MVLVSDHKLPFNFANQRLCYYYTHTHIATVAILVEGALLNALAFTGAYTLKKSLMGGDNGSLAEKKRHDLAIEKYQKEYVAVVVVVKQSFDRSRTHMPT